MKRKKKERSSEIPSNQQPKTKKFKPQPKKPKNSVFVQPKLPKSEEEVSSNWIALQKLLSKENPAKDKAPSSLRLKHKGQKSKTTALKRKEQDEKLKNKNLDRDEDEIWFDDVDAEDIERASGRKIHNASKETVCTSKKDLAVGGFEGLTKRIAMDCEFVGVGRDGKRNMLAHVSVVNSHGCTVYDEYVAPRETVTDYRTAVSGVRSSDLKNAPDFKTVQKEVADMLKGRILIGHAIKNDLQVLFLDHPKKDIRDTAKYKPFHKIAKSQYPSLKKLSQEILHARIQEGEHSSVQDAQAAMRLYILHKRQWEKQIKDKKFKRTQEKDDDS
ncbi:RNA exonuclease 4-like isoform X1 [Actinia tenebrosa]|uniref:RNA exonuclease 4 n=1 Tax=Actinia tenebrosa TaxID=6105 RepID=A0A6P8IL86_ACTTE|nr:RNA exonuclease 4-like isoform X1 [Actinia tenebrosa]XP_031567183.1 RNA exonuclease 4-like isoform X1 [Actinia tenebrosa]